MIVISDDYEVVVLCALHESLLPSVIVSWETIIVRIFHPGKALFQISFVHIPLEDISFTVIEIDVFERSVVHIGMENHMVDVQVLFHKHSHVPVSAPHALSQLAFGQLKVGNASWWHRKLNIIGCWIVFSWAGSLWWTQIANALVEFHFEIVIVSWQGIIPFIWEIQKCHLQVLLMVVEINIVKSPFIDDNALVTSVIDFISEDNIIFVKVSFTPTDDILWNIFSSFNVNLIPQLSFDEIQLLNAARWHTFVIESIHVSVVSSITIWITSHLLAAAIWDGIDLWFLAEHWSETWFFGASDAKEKCNGVFHIWCFKLYSIKWISLYK